MTAAFEILLGFGPTLFVHELGQVPAQAFLDGVPEHRGHLSIDEGGLRVRVDLPHPFQTRRHDRSVLLFAPARSAFRALQRGHVNSENRHESHLASFVEHWAQMIQEVALSTRVFEHDSLTTERKVHLQLSLLGHVRWQETQRRLAYQNLSINP